MKESPVTTVTVEELEADPYPVYARLRREAPVSFVPAVGLWFVTRHDDVDFVASRPDLFTAELDDSPVDRTFGSPTIITVDGEPHLDLRRGLDSKYRPKHVHGYIDDLVRPIAERVLDGLAGRDRAELMADYFEPVSVLSLGRVLGVDHLGADRLRDWFWRLHQGVINFERDPERATRRRWSAPVRSITCSPRYSTGWRRPATTARSPTCCTAACPPAPAGPGTS